MATASAFDKQGFDGPTSWMAYLGLGANLPWDGALPEQTLWRVSYALGDLGQVIACSGLWRTEPVGPVPDQPPFVNAAVVLKTGFTPEKLLTALLNLEQYYGRVRGPIAKGPRTLDLDLLLIERLPFHEGEAQPVLLQTPELKLPHPELHRRRFALAPLAEIAPGLRHPELGRTIKELLQELPPGERVERMRSLESAVGA